MSKHRIENTHHIIGKSLGSEYNVHVDNNKIRIDMNRHNALHALFGVLLTPKEQLMELKYLYDGVLSDTAKQLFNELISLNDKEFYTKNILKWKRK